MPSSKVSSINIGLSSSITQPGDFLELALLNAWLDVADTGLLVLDQDQRVVMINASAGQLLFTDPTLRMGQAVKTALANVERWPQLLEWLDAAASGDQRQFSVRPLSQKAGEGLSHCTFKLRRLSMAGQVWRVIAINDVTKWVQAQQELEASRRQWQALNAGVVITDATQPDLPIVFVNKAFEEMTGYTTPEILGRNCRFLQGGDTDQEGLQTIRKALLNKTNGYAVMRNYRKDGSMFYNELFISPVRNESGTVTHFVGIQHMRDERYRDTPGLLGQQAADKFGAWGIN